MSGLEIIGLAASVIQIADIGSRLSVKVFTFTRKVKNANKSIEALSQDIASTGAVLKQLGETLNGNDGLRVCSQEAIETARRLVEDTNQVFAELERLVDGEDKSGSKLKQAIGFKQRLKFPFFEPQIERVQSNLERLKSSLLVILNVLIFAEQLRNKETLPILEEQRDLIKVLASEKDENEKRYNRILKAIATNPRSDSAGPLSSDTGSANLSRVSTVVASEKEVLKSMVCMNAQDLQEDTLPAIDLPRGLKHCHETIHHHSSLIQSLLTEIASHQHKVDFGIRDRMHNGVLELHWNEWASHRLHYKFELFEAILAGHPEVARHWAGQSIQAELLLAARGLQRDSQTAKPKSKSAKSASKAKQSVNASTKPRKSVRGHHNYAHQHDHERHRDSTSESNMTDEESYAPEEGRSLAVESVAFAPATAGKDMITTIRNIVAEELMIHPDEVRDDTSLASIGLDFLMVTIVLEKLRDEHDLDLDRIIFDDAPTLGHLRRSLGLDKPAPAAKSAPATKPAPAAKDPITAQAGPALGPQAPSKVAGHSFNNQNGSVRSLFLNLDNMVDHVATTRQPIKVRKPSANEEEAMQLFNSHFELCEHCCRSLPLWPKSGPLCSDGHNLMTHMLRYFLCDFDKLYSVDDHEQRKELTSVLIPAELPVIKKLTEALSAGYSVEWRPVTVATRQVVTVGGSGQPSQPSMPMHGVLVPKMKGLPQLHVNHQMRQRNSGSSVTSSSIASCTSEERGQDVTELSTKPHDLVKDEAVRTSDNVFDDIDQLVLRFSSIQAEELSAFVRAREYGEIATTR